MTIRSFLAEYIDEVHAIIDELDPSFDSHAFIQRFKHRFESDYTDFLHHYQKSADEHEAARKVHGQIAWFLSKNAATLRIEKTDRPHTPNVFGNKSENQGWRKL